METLHTGAESQIAIQTETSGRRRGVPSPLPGASPVAFRLAGTGSAHAAGRTDARRRGRDGRCGPIMPAVLPPTTAPTGLRHDDLDAPSGLAELTVLTELMQDGTLEAVPAEPIVLADLPPATTDRASSLSSWFGSEGKDR